GGFASTGTVNFNGTSATAVGGDAAPVLQDVNINNTGGVAPGNNWTVNGTFTVGGGGIFTAGSATHIFNGLFNNQGTVTSSGALNFTPSSPVTVTLRPVPPAPGLFSSAGTVMFGGSGPITLAGGSPSFNSVTIANTHPAGLTPPANWILVGDLLIADGALLNGGAGLTHTLLGNWTDNGTFNGAGCTISMNGETDIAGIGSTTFNHLFIVGTVTAMTDFDVAGNFTNNGLFDGTGATISFVGSAPSSLGGTTTPTPLDSLHV